MTHRRLFTLMMTLLATGCLFGQASTRGMTIVTEEINKEITKIVTSETKKTTRTIEKAPEELILKAEVWPNPSNLGKVRLSLENLPETPLFIQIFNDEEELIQEGVINGTLGASLQHTLTLPDTSGTYSIKLSDPQKIIKDLELQIL